MPRPARGRGKMRGRGRMSSTLRATLRDHGITATAEYVGNQSDVMGTAVDAARAYYPPLERAAVAKEPTQAEITMLSRHRMIERTLRSHPARASPPPEHARNSLSAELALIERFVISSNSNGDRTAQKQPKMDSFSVLELLPVELRPSKKRKLAPAANNIPADGSAKPIAKNRVKNEISLLMDEVAAGKQPGEEDDQTINQTQKDSTLKDNENTRRKSDDPDAPPDNEFHDDADEDQDEIDADYNTGQQFDDDDGYEENDSGEDVAVM